jgi:hypothetical protein
MKKFLALLAVVASFAFSSTAFAQHHHGGNGGVNIQVSPWGTSLNIGGRNGVTITDGYGWNGGHHGWDNRRWDNRRWDNRRWDNRRWDNRGPVIIIPAPRRDYHYDRPVVIQRPYYYFDANGREVFVDQYGRARYTGYIRGDRGCYNYNYCD